jgi:DNA-nicking Smr family endonuclease
VKKKNTATDIDKRDWETFINQSGPIYDKENYFTDKKNTTKEIQRLDLHGYSLDEANKIVKKFINKYFNSKYKCLLIITGKGLRSKVSENPYVSEKMNVLRYSVPDYIKNDESLNNKISKISKADIVDGGEGAIYIFLKDNKKFTK